MKRRAQASLEYVITYGWAFVVILIVLGALAYFGVLNPSKWVADDCDFGAQMECVDYQVSAGGPSVDLFVRNNFGKEITIHNVHVLAENGDNIGLIPVVSPDPLICTQARCNISSGSTQEVKIIKVHYPDTTPVLFEGDKQRLIIEINFSRSGSTNYHTIVGSLYTTTKA